MERIKESKDRERSIVKSEKRLFRKLTSLQNELAELVLSLLFDRIVFEDGKAVATAANFNTIASIGTLYEQWAQSSSNDVMKIVMQGIRQVHKDNERYFSKVVGKSVQTKSLQIFNILLARLGITKDNKIKTGGFLHSVLTTGDPITELKNEALRSIISGQSLTAFKKSIANRIKGTPETSGLVEQHFQRHLYDLWQQYDREAGRQFAEKLDLKYAIYQGGLIKTSRPFCKVRNNKVFTSEEIALFGTPKDKYGGYSDKSTGDFQGKNEIYNPFLDCGGYNCRHRWDYVSDKLGEFLYKQQNSEPEQVSDN